MSDETQKKPESEHSSSYTGYQYPWMVDAKAAKAEKSLRHLPPMLRRKPGGKAR